MGKYADSERLAKRSLQIYMESLGVDYPAIEQHNTYVRRLSVRYQGLLICSLSAAYVNYLEGNLVEAEEGLKNSLAASERTYGASHLCVAQSLADLATFYCKIQKYNEVRKPKPHEIASVLI